MGKWIVMTGLVGMSVCKTENTAAQYYYLNDKYYNSSLVIEAGCSGGIMNSFTDLGGHKGLGKGFIKDLNWKTTRPDFSFYLLAMYKDAFAIRAEATRGSIHSYDSILKTKDADLNGRYGRNLSFKTTITDFQLDAEIHPLFFIQYEEDKAPYWSPYLIAGIGCFLFNPQANLDGNWYALHPLRLEGQGFNEYPNRKDYRLQQLLIPLGVGVKYEISTIFNARLEVVHRMLFTDYLDDVSTEYIDPALFTKYLTPAQAMIAQQLYSRRHELEPGFVRDKGTERGDASDKDAYFSVQLKVGWIIRLRRK